MKTTIISIQYLRGIAAFLVLMSHVFIKLQQLGYEAFETISFGGACGVDLFFVISGYVICLTTHRRESGYHVSKAFLFRRCQRILPLYWGLTIVMLPMFFLYADVIYSGGSERDLIASFFLLPSDKYLLVQNGWTLVFEMYFYILFAIALLRTTIKVRYLLITSMIVGPVVFGLFYSGSSVYYRLLTNSMLCEFLYGVGLFLLVGRTHSSKWLLLPIFGVFTILLGLGILILRDFEHTNSTRFFYIGLPAAIICYGFLCMEKWLSAKPISALKLLGDSSYSLYLFHPFVLTAFLFIVKGFDFPQWSMFPVAITMVLLSILFSFVTYVAIEDSAMKFFKKSRKEDYLIYFYYKRILRLCGQ
jgi:peptidoglycan/LPS O-acetylase OafA/YrhL